MKLQFLVASVLALTLSVTAKAGKTEYDAETQRRINLAKQHMSAEEQEANGKQEFEGTMDTLQDEPVYNVNGATVEGHDVILGMYKQFFGSLENVKFEARKGGMFVSEGAISFHLTLTANVKGNPKGKIKLPMFVAFVYDKVGGKIVGEHAYFDSNVFTKQFTAATAK